MQIQNYQKGEEGVLTLTIKPKPNSGKTVEQISNEAAPAGLAWLKALVDAGADIKFDGSYGDHVVFDLT